MVINTKVRVALPKVRLDNLCFEHYGYVHGAVEAVLSANLGLAGLGPFIPVGTLVYLPGLAQKDRSAEVPEWLFGHNSPCCFSCRRWR